MNENVPAVVRRLKSSIAFISFMFVILVSVPAWAGTTALEVKETITPDFNKCVRVIKKPEYYKKWGKISIYAPPLSKMDLATLAYIQKNDIGRIEYCNEKKT